MKIDVVTLEAFVVCIFRPDVLLAAEWRDCDSSTLTKAYQIIGQSTIKVNLEKKKVQC